MSERDSVETAKVTNVTESEWSVLERIVIVVTAPVWIPLMIVALSVYAIVGVCFALPAITGLPYICTGRFNGWFHWFQHKTGDCQPTGLPFDTKPCPYGD